MLAQWDNVNDPGIIGILAVVTIVVGIVFTVVTIYIQSSKFKKEIDLLKADLVSKSASTLELLQKARAAYNDQVERFTAAALLVRDALELVPPDPIAVDKARDMCCNLLSGTINLSINFCELEELYYQHDPSRLEGFICNELCEDIAILTNRIRVLNSQAMLDRLPPGRSRYPITLRTVRPWVKIVQGLPEDRQLLARERVQQRIDELMKHVEPVAG